MKLTQKMACLTLLVGLVLAIGIILIVQSGMEKQALDVARVKANILLRNRLATNDYWNQDLRPKIFALLEEKELSDDFFDPAWMSVGYANRLIAKYFASDELDGYIYKNAAVNARSPANEANDYEKVFLNKLATDPAISEWSGVKTLDGKPYYVKMVRNVNFSAICLRCHSTPENAPADLVRLYGNKRSFNKNIGDVASVISVRVPMEKTYTAAAEMSEQLIFFLAGLIGVTLLVQLILMRRVVVQPIRALINKANRITEHTDAVGETISENSSRELRQLAEAFSAMSKSLADERNSLEEAVKERTVELVESNRQLEEQIVQRERAVEKRLELEAELRQKHKMEAIGVLAGGLAHNFNNNFSIILGNIEIAQHKKFDPLTVNEFLNKSKSALFKSRDLIKQIMLYSQIDFQTKQTCGLGSVVEECLAEFRPEIPPEIQLDSDLTAAGSAAQISADSEQLKKLLRNLCENAVLAIQGEGSIAVSLDQKNLSADMLPELYSGQPGKFLYLQVRDDGCGIPADDIEKVFDPFYTTREVGQGTGMGLALVSGIVEQHHGFVNVQSDEGRGTTFSVYFPAADD